MIDNVLVGSLIFLVLLLLGTTGYVYFYDLAWDRSIVRVGKIKIKHENGFYVVYVYNYFWEDNGKTTGFHYERIGECYTKEHAKIMADSASKTIKDYFIDWSSKHRVV